MVEMQEYMLTTVDNPHSPFDDFDEWYAFDTNQGHHSLSLLSRVIITSNELSEADQRLAYERAVDEIVEHNVSGIHKKVSREVPTLDY